MKNTQNNEVRQIVSRNFNNKALILQLSNDKFEVNVYEWCDKKFDDEERNLWERVAGPFILDFLEEAETVAIENLQLFSLELPDTSIDKNLQIFVEEILGHDDFDFFLPQNFEMEFLENPEKEIFCALSPEKVLCVQDFYFIESKNQWIQGILTKKGRLRGWKRFPNLKTALKEILKKNKK
ncbi:hypothetical protein KAI58_00635 [Candidatus Gracilibacteria bacterium]|nr:hypothetical protein [Candidatus Gracilibacteria bacterium]